MLRALAWLFFCGLLTAVAGQEDSGNGTRILNGEEIKEFFRKGIPENLSGQRLNISVVCSQGEAFRIAYRLEGTNGLTIGRYSGHIFIVKPFDYEKTTTSDASGTGRTIKLTISCTEMDETFQPLPDKNPATLVVTLNLLDMNDNPPEFFVKGGEFSLTVDEDAPVGTVLQPSLSVTDNDTTGTNAELYSVEFICDDTVENPEACDFFTVSFRQKSVALYEVNITLIKPLDYETRIVYNTALLAKDGEPGNHLETKLTVQINVADSQDRPPEFFNTDLKFDIFEGTAVDSLVNFRLIARDGDVGRNARRAIHFEILDTNLEVSELFYADPAQPILDDIPTDDRPLLYSAQLRVKKEIDRERDSDTYKFYAQAIELDNGTLTADRALLEITAFILDINDNGPVFSQSRYNVTMNEVTPSSAVIQVPNLRMDVSDPDQSSNAHYRVFIEDQSTPGAFGVTPSGDVTGFNTFFLSVNNYQLLDYEEPSTREQTVRVKAVELIGNNFGSKSSDATVTITLMNINDHAPRFLQDKYSASVRENAAILTSILTIKATDADAGDFGNVKYSIRDITDTFAVDENTGVITLIKALDYETKEEYTFFASATDSRFTAQVEVSILVLDYNDQGPQFQLSTYSASVPENSRIFVTDVYVKATDPDQKPDTVITYSIVSGNTPTNSFVMDRTTGQLSLREELDYESIPGGGSSYTLVVQASDNGQPPLTAETRITVTVLDANDFSPVFAQKTYQTTISETVAPGTSLLQVSATDGDRGSNGEIKYRISSGARDNFVVYNNGTFAVSNVPTFDFDENRQYNVEIRASDGGSPQKFDIATVVVTVTDANNKNPEFENTLYRGRVDEDAMPGTNVLQVRATDPDQQFQLEYSIDRTSITALNSGGTPVTSRLDYDFTELFEMEKSSGVIKVKGTLDRSKVVEVAFLAKVKDIHPTAIGDQTATTRVNIIITGEVSRELYFDPPWSKSNPVYQYNVLESRPVGSQLITLHVRDPDIESVDVLTFQEVQGSDLENYFAVGRDTGVVSLQKRLDYDTGDREKSVTVLARKGSRTVSATVKITVLDVNDNAPEFSQPVYRFSVREGTGSRSVVGQITVFDVDSSSFGAMEFAVQGPGSEDFAFAPSTVDNSVMFVVAEGQELDYETRNEYTLTVTVYDDADGSGAIRNVARAWVIVNVTDTNDNTPTFDETSRTFSIPETAPINYVLGQIQAIDKDKGRLNNEVLYTFQLIPGNVYPENPLQLFGVSERSGIVFTKQLLTDRKGVYDMLLVATDQGIPPRSSSIAVTIKVQGVQDDDGTPKWIRPFNNEVVEIYEHEPNTVLPLTVLAQARTPDALTTYAFNAFQDDYKHFFINPQNGTITVISDLDREEKENYTLVIVATDSITSQISTRTLLVRLLDKDDNRPSFKKQFSACPTDFEVPTLVYAWDNTPKGEVIARATACDPDGPQFNGMVYSLYLGNELCRAENVDAFTVTPEGEVVSNKMLDYEERTEYLVCVEVRPHVNQRKKRETEHTRQKREIDPDAMIPDDTVAYFLIKIRDINDHGPEFPEDSKTAVLQTAPISNFVAQVKATDLDGPLHSAVRYRIANTVYFPGDGSPPYSMDTAFKINHKTGIVSTNMLSYRDFSGGYFILNIVAQDYESAEFSDYLQLKIVVHERSQVLRAVLDMKPSEGRVKAPELIEELNAVDSQVQFYFLSASEHRTLEDPVDSQTDICFVVVQNNAVYDASSGLGLLAARYSTILGTDDFKVVDRGTCFPLRSSAESLKWRDLWWVLVAIAIFIFICCLILLATIFILYDRYRNYMNTQRTYLVPQ